MLGEEFDSLAQARRAYKSETLPFVAPNKADISTADGYEEYYQQYDGYDLEFEDQGEVDAGVDY